MKEKIDLKILWAELRNKIIEFYPYFLGFYILSLITSVFSSIWKNFFYWPAFHGSAIIFTVLFLLAFRFNLRIKFKFNSIFLKKYQLSYKFIAKTINLFRLSFKFNLNFKEKYLLWRIFILEITKSLLISIKDFFNFFIHLIKTFSHTANRLIKNYFLFIKKKIFAISRRSWLKIIIIVAVLIFALFKEIGVLNFLVLFYALISFLFILDSRGAAGVALILLASCPVLLILKKDILAENTAIYAYYFLVITVLTQIRELARDKRAENIAE